MNQNPLLAPLFARVTVALSRTSHPGNIGSAARALKTMGFSRLALISPAIFPAPEATALASGADDVLEKARVTDTLDDALRDAACAVAVSARARDLGPTLLSARAGAAEIMRCAAAGEEIAVLFGNETSGLSNDELRRCQYALMIPANPEYSSLNLAAAVQVVCYELRMAALSEAERTFKDAGAQPGTGADTRALAMGRVTPYASARATQGDLEAFYAHLEKVMRASGFLHPERPGRLMPKLRRLFARARPEREEINILRGLLSTWPEKESL
ncbi:MAG: RNA methyltransferase [Zoogloeaceae bacterium]|jgi:tRNA/rRNA methyltransferase|nr:RNA methyltransferase [Zoogloeaceae bacterium]